MTPIQYTKSNTVLKVTDVSLSLGGNKILRDINIDVKENMWGEDCVGQIISLLAPSGLGKTQLFKIIAGLQKPTTGNVEIMGKIMHEVALGEIGVIGQSYPLFPYMTVKENLEIAAKFLPKEERKIKVDSFVENFSLTDKLNLYPAQLSGGQRQRVAIAQQMICAKRYILMDEPYSGQDVLIINRLNEMIVKAAKDYDLTIIIVSHDIGSVCAISDMVLLMGKEKDENGQNIPGATLMYQHDLAAMGLAWQPDLRSLPEFSAFTTLVREEFKTLI